MARKRKPENIPRDELVNAGEIATLLGTRQQNVHKWLRHPSRAIVPVREDPHPTGRLYSRAEILAAAEIWKADDRRASDEKRRVTALANLGK